MSIGKEIVTFASRALKPRSRLCSEILRAARWLFNLRAEWGASTSFGSTALHNASDRSFLMFAPPTVCSHAVLNLDVRRGDVDVKVDAEPLGEPNQRVHAGIVIDRGAASSANRFPW
jgi:hypothetical protein